MIKYLLISSLVLVSACSTSIPKPEPIETSPVVVQLPVIEEKPKEKAVSVFQLCDNCSNPEELKAYFDSINYDKVAKSNFLILKNINKGLFSSKNTKVRKDVFFKSIYPLAYKVNKEIEAERKDLLNGKNLDKLKKKYRSDDVADLKARINTIPTTIILAQAAIESAYGTSRFAEEGNALFGQWTTDPKGMTPREKPDSKWKVARFNTPLDSTRAYALNINTHHTYKEFRRLRSAGKDPMDGLGKYSQKGDEYMKILNSIIKNNDLNIYK